MRQVGYLPEHKHI